MDHDWRRRTQGSGPADEAAAAQLLAEVAPLQERSRRLAAGQLTRRSLVAWGVVWIVGYAAVQFLGAPIGLLVFGVLAVAAAVLIQVLPVQLRNGWERPARACWWLIAGSMAVLAVIVEPSPLPTVLLLLGALWGLVLALYAIAAADRTLAVLGIGILLSAGVVHLWVATWSLLVFGLVAGVAMAALGTLRLLRPA